MLRIIYVAGVNRRHLAEVADPVPYWLLSVSLMPRRGPPAWLEPYLRRNIIWDPGTFSQEARTYPQYRAWLDRWVLSHHRYLAYDEVGGDPALNLAYLQDMRRRGYRPIPVYHPGMPRELLLEPEVALGSLVPMTDQQRIQYLDELFYGPGPRPAGRVHLLGLMHRRWFTRYPATSGDSTTWVRRGQWNRKLSPAEWMREYGEQWIPWHPPAHVQARLAL